MSEPKFEIGQKVTICFGGVVHDTFAIEHMECRNGKWFYRSGEYRTAEFLLRPWMPEDDAPAQRARDMRTVECCAQHNQWGRLSDEAIHEIANIIRRREGEQGEET